MCVVTRSSQRQAVDTKPIQKERNIQLAVQRCTNLSEDQSIARFPQQELFLFRCHGDMVMIHARPRLAIKLWSETHRFSLESLGKITGSAQEASESHRFQR
jgi:hypothetical protein